MTVRLTDDDVSQAALALGCETAALQAVIEVEAGGSGLDSKGRVRALFEPHVFHRMLPAGPLRDQAVAEGLAYPNWQPGNYPDADGVWDQIDRACAISEDAALQSVSWGVGQVMGFNWVGSRYDSVQDLVLDMATGEAAQLALMIGFIERAGLAGKLRDRDWPGFARGYNGPGYALNRYEWKLAAAYARHAGQ